MTHEDASARRAIWLNGRYASFIQPFLSKGEKAEGVVNADLRAGGTLIKPELYGSATLEDVVVNADLVPFDMEPQDWSCVLTAALPP